MHLERINDHRRITPALTGMLSHWGGTQIDKFVPELAEFTSTFAHG